MMLAESATRRENGGRLHMIVFILLLAALSFAPLLYTGAKCGEIEHDEGHYALVSRVLLDGGTMYRDVYDNKLPVFYFFTSLAEKTCGTDFFCMRTLVLGINFAIALIVFAISSKRIGGILKYQPPLMFILFASVMETDIFLRCEPFILLAWALGFFFLDRFLSRGNARELAAAGFFAVIPLFIKPLAALGLALPIAYAVLEGKVDARGSVAHLAAGAIAAFLLCAAYSLYSTDFGAFLGQANGWAAGELAAAVFTTDFLRATAVYLLLVAGMAVPLYPVFLDKKRGGFWNMVLLFFAGVAVLFFMRGFSFGPYTLVLPYFFIPLSFAWAPFVEWMRTLAVPKKLPAETLKSYALLWVCASLVALSFLLLSTLNYFQLNTSSAVSFCGENGAMIAHIGADDNGTFFVFPSRATYYLVLGKKPLFPLIYHHSVSDIPQTDGWFENNVLLPVEGKMPDHILYFNGTNDRSSFTGESLGRWESFLGANYAPEYYDISGDQAIYYTRKTP